MITDGDILILPKPLALSENWAEILASHVVNDYSVAVYAFALFFHHPPYFLTSWGRRHTTNPHTSTSSSNFFYPAPKKSGRFLPNFILNSWVTTRLGMLSNYIGMKSSRIHWNTNQFRMQLNAKEKAIPTTIPFGASASATTTRMTMRMTVTSSESGSLRDLRIK